MSKQNNLPKLLLIITLGTVPIFNSCTEETIVERIIFPDNNDDQQTRNTIVAYNIFNDNLYLDKSFPVPDNASAYIKKEIWEKEQRAIDEHKKKFKLFTDIIPAEYRKEITQLTFFYPEEGPYTYAYMGVRKNSSLSQFSLGLSYEIGKDKTKIPSVSGPNNKFNTLGYDFTIYIMIHEFGHYITKNKTQQYLSYNPKSDRYIPVYKEGSYIKQIFEISWSKIPIEIVTTGDANKIFNTIPGNFVSLYACASIDEDAAETFTHFVLSNDKPEDVDGKSKKILLFYKDPDMLAIRNGIRKNLQKLGIKTDIPNK